ncbi:MAG: polyphosphate:AMP phosphotransferase [Polyangiales bacterium]
MARSIFDTIDKQKKLDKGAYETREAKLRVKLLHAQYDVLDEKRFPVVIVIGGVPGAGRGETVNLLHEWMDPRNIASHSLGAPSDEELERPPMWRFWRRLPPKGKMGIFFGSWYTQPIVAHVTGSTSNKDLDGAIDEIRRFETMLAREGALVLKFWFHLTKKEQKKRLTELQSDERTAWRVTKEDWKSYARFDEFERISARVLEATSTEDAPWTLVDGSDRHRRSLFVGDTLLTAMREKLASKDGASKKHAAPPKPKKVRPVTVFAGVDLNQKIDKDDYKKQLEEQQMKLALLTRNKKFKKLSPVLVFEGMDAAGKGGAIRRVTQAIDARIYDVIPIAAPTEEERAQPYLWRFWRHAPRDGKFAIFDRSWYGRVLVERVEGFSSEDAWRRAYDEISDFEKQLARAGGPIAKFWLQTSAEEQLRRFKEREATQWKQFKITPDDWRNREKWDLYQIAASEMIERTSPPNAPWTIVEAEDKYFARVKILKTVIATIERAL